MPAHIYFDLDGTLTDPYEGISRCIVYAIERLGVARPTDDELRNMIGPPLWDTFPALVGKDLTLRAVELYRQRFDRVGWQENTPYDGICDALAAIRASGARLFVATSKPQVAAIRILTHFGLAPYFDAIYGSELDGRRSNKGALLAYAIEQNAVADKRYMVGDRKHDLIGALANGITPIGVSYGFGSVDELEAAGAVAIAATPGELSSLLPSQ